MSAQHDRTAANGHVLTVTIPTDLPAALSPNARVSWPAKHRATKAARAAAGWSAKDAVGRAVLAGDLVIGDPADDRLRLDATIYWAKGRKTMDDDNAWMMLKPVRDGLADALNRNDRDFTLGTMTQERDKDGRGYVVLDVSPLP